MRSAFEQAVLVGIELLRELPRERTQVDEARRRLAAFRREHPGVQVELVTDWSGGSARVDYDLLIRDGQRGTLALSHARDGGSPWSIEHAEHWAAQRLLTVDGQPLSVHDALRLWQARAALGPSLMDELLDEALVAGALADDDAEVGPDEAQRAADAIRRRLGLGERVRTLAWLERHGLSRAGFEELARREARRERWLDRMFAAEGRAHFEQHRDEFECVDVFLVHGAVGTLEELAAEARSGGSLLAAVGERLRAGAAGALEGTLERRFSWQLPDLLRSAAPLQVVGPWQEGDRCWLAQVLARSASELDAEVRRSVRSVLFERWLAHARAAADVRWHWL